MWERLDILDRYVGDVGHIGQICGRGWTHWTDMWKRLDTLVRMWERLDILDRYVGDVGHIGHIGQGWGRGWTHYIFYERMCIVQCAVGMGGEVVVEGEGFFGKSMDKGVRKGIGM